MLVLAAVIVLIVLIVIVFMSRAASSGPSLTGQNVLITGVSSHNLGEAFAVECVRQGAGHVFLFHWRAQDIHGVVKRVSATTPMSTRLNGTAVVSALELDLTNDEAVLQAIQALPVPPSVALVNHVICSHFDGALSIPTPVVRMHLEVNFVSVVNLVQCLMRQHALRRLVVVSSMAALLPQPNRSAYCKRTFLQKRDVLLIRVSRCFKGCTFLMDLLLGTGKSSSKHSTCPSRYCKLRAYITILFVLTIVDRHD
jgi:NADP-dependent 3-hydroxy acid dehydrogenase YdfG